MSAENPTKPASQKQETVPNSEIEEMQEQYRATSIVADTIRMEWNAVYGLAPLDGTEEKKQEREAIRANLTAEAHPSSVPLEEEHISDALKAKLTSLGISTDGLDYSTNLFTLGHEVMERVTHRQRELATKIDTARLAIPEEKERMMREKVARIEENSAPGNTIYTAIREKASALFKAKSEGKTPTVDNLAFYVMRPWQGFGTLTTGLPEIVKEVTQRVMLEALKNPEQLEISTEEMESIIERVTEFAFRTSEFDHYPETNPYTLNSKEAREATALMKEVRALGQQPL